MTTVSDSTFEAVALDVALADLSWVTRDAALADMGDHAARAAALIRGLARLSGKALGARGATADLSQISEAFAVAAKGGSRPEFCLRDMLAGLAALPAIASALDATKDHAPILVGGVDPAAGECFELFEHIKERTLCPYAKAGAFWTGVAWDAGRSITENVIAQLPILGAYATYEAMFELDGLALILPETLGRSVDQLASTLYDVVEAIKASEVESPWPLPIGADHVELAGLPMFITALAPCYGALHARGALGVDRTIFLFQSLPSLDAHPALARSESKTRARVSEAFRAGGAAYTNEICARRIERYVRPLGYEDPPLAWWTGRLAGGEGVALRGECLDRC
jgi:hypothetical protein